jgi:hypothetical protein
MARKKPRRPEPSELEVMQAVGDLAVRVVTQANEQACHVLVKVGYPLGRTVTVTATPSGHESKVEE